MKSKCNWLFSFISLALSARYAAASKLALVLSIEVEDKSAFEDLVVRETLLS